MRPAPPLLALLAASLALPGCSRRAPASPDTYVHLVISDLDSLDPAWSYDTASHAAISDIYETLLAYKAGTAGELEPLLSEKVPSAANGLVSADGRTYRFPIRRGVRFHGGEALTPEDARYSLMRFMLADRDAGPSSILLEPIVGYAGTRDDKGRPRETAFDDVAKAVLVENGHLVVTLKRPFAPFLSILASWAPVLPKAWCAKGGEWDGEKATWRKHNNPAKESSFLLDHANGTGPFMLERRDPRAKELALARFDGYWGGPAKLKRALIKCVDEFATRKLMLQAGDADSIYTETQQRPLLESLDGVEIIGSLPVVTMNPMAFFTFRVETAANPNVGSGKLDGEGVPADFFSDPDVRKGFLHAFDYDGYIRDVARGDGTRAAGFIPKGLLGHREGLPRWEYDMAKAAAHLKKARGGLVWEKGFRFTIAYNAGHQAREAIAGMLKRSIESINPRFRIDTRPIQWSTYLDQMNHAKLPLFVLGWNADYPDPHNFAFTLMHSQGSMAQIQRYKNPRADRLVAEAAAEADPKRRAELYERLHALYLEDGPSMPILDTVRYRAQRSWVRGFVNRPMWPDNPWRSPLHSLEKAPG